MYVYILLCANGTYYIGSTPNIANRLEEHQRGKNFSTKYLLPVELVFSQKFPTLPIARKVEYWIKRQKSRSFIERIIEEGKITKQFT